jgi:phosphoenolpyruvate-protein phosphotransferase (PTS system enzyme I)
MEAKRDLEFKGIGVSPGVVAGPVLVLQTDDAPLPEYSIPAEDIPREMIRLEAALIETRRQLHDIQQRVGEAMGGESAGIFEAHLQVVDDPSFVDEVYRDVRDKRKNIEKIFVDVAERYAETLLQMEDDYLRERADGHPRRDPPRIAQPDGRGARPAGRAGGAAHPGGA